MYFHFVVLDFVTTDQLLHIFVVLKAATDSFCKISLICLQIKQVFQCLRTTLLMFGRDWLYVNTRRIFVSFEVLLSFFLKFFPVNFFYSFYLFICWLWLVSLIDKFLLKLRTILIEIIWFSAYLFDSKRLAIYEIISFSDLGCSEST